MIDNDTPHKKSKLHSTSCGDIDEMHLTPTKTLHNEANDLHFSQTDSTGGQFKKVTYLKMRNSHIEDSTDVNHNGSMYNSISISTSSINPRQVYQEKANKEHQLERKLRDVNLQINKLKEENIKVSRLREDYEKLTSKLQKDIRDFNAKKELEKEQFLNWKNEEIFSISKAKADLAKEQKQWQAAKGKQSTGGNSCELINSFKVRINILQDKAKQDKSLIDSLRKEIELLNSSKSKAQSLPQPFLTISPVTKLKEQFVQYDNSLSYGLKASFDFLIEEQYTIASDMSKEEHRDGKVIRSFTCGKYEIVFQSGIKRVVYKDGHQIIYFPNGDINQIHPQGKEVFLFKENATIQTKFPDGTIVLKFKDGQIEKHFPDKSREIILNDGTVTYITSEGYEETFFPNEDIHITNRKDKTVTLYRKEWRIEVSKAN